jgi:hypothetical protein
MHCQGSVALAGSPRALSLQTSATGVPCVVCYTRLRSSWTGIEGHREGRDLPPVPQDELQEDGNGWKGRDSSHKKARGRCSCYPGSRMPTCAIARFDNPPAWVGRLSEGS